MFFQSNSSDCCNYKSQYNIYNGVENIKDIVICWGCEKPGLKIKEKNTSSVLANNPKEKFIDKIEVFIIEVNSNF